MSQLKDYHLSIGKELVAIKDRVRLLLGDSIHWPADGTHKEDILKEVLRRHLPITTGLYSGFVRLEDNCTKQIDIILTDETKNSLFKSNDFCITTPSSTHAIIEVKTKIANDNDLKNALNGICNNIAKIRTLKSTVSPRNFTHNYSHPWSALFSYEGYEDISADTAQKILEIFDEQAMGDVKKIIQCACLGPDLFIKFWPVSSRWEAYKLKDLAYSYFISNILWQDQEWNNESPLWFPLVEGKDPYKIAEHSIRINR